MEEITALAKWLYISPLVCFGEILSWVTKLRFFWTPSEQIIVWRLLWKLNNAFCQMGSITFALLMLSHHLLSFSAWHCRRGWVEIKSSPYCNFIFLAFCNLDIDFPGRQINDPLLQKNIDQWSLSFIHQLPGLLSVLAIWSAFWADTAPCKDPQPCLVHGVQRNYTALVSEVKVLHQEQLTQTLILCLYKHTF